MISYMKKPGAYLGLGLLGGLVVADAADKAQAAQHSEQHRDRGGVDYTVLKLFAGSSSQSLSDVTYFANPITDAEYRVVWPRDWQRLNISEVRRDRKPMTFALEVRDVLPKAESN